MNKWLEIPLGPERKILEIPLGPARKILQHIQSK
jgi:hypothetical protein